MVLDVVLETSATITGVAGSFAVIPQVYRIFKRKSAKDIPIWTYLYMLVAGVIWILYGLNIEFSHLDHQPNRYFDKDRYCCWLDLVW